MEAIFGSLAIVVGMAAAGGAAAKVLRQPVILGYVAAGAAVTWGGMLGTDQSRTMLELMGRLGVTFLLFLMGLELPLSELKKMGRVALATGLGQIFFTTAAGFVIVRALGYPPLTASYLALALAFSSTIIIVKLLSEKRELTSLHGKIAVGFLLVQDFVAVGMLSVLSGLSGVTAGKWEVLIGVGVKAGLLVAATFGLAYWVIPKLGSFLARSTEVLFVSSVAWCLGVAALVASRPVGFSPEIGGFLAGLALANLPEHLQVAARMRPLRDFFLLLFFVWLGTGLAWVNVGHLWWQVGVLAVFVLVVNPVIMMTIMGIMGYRKRTLFLAGLTVGQISEFSLVLVSLAVKLGHVGADALTLTILVGVVTMTGSTYMILYSDWLYKRLGPVLGVFERKKIVTKSQIGQGDSRPRVGHILLLGYSRTGRTLLPALAKTDRRMVIVDFNPQVVEDLQSRGVEAVYGDIGDPEMYGEINLDEASLVVSTIPDVEDNLRLLEAVKGMKKKRPAVAVVAQDEVDSGRLNKAGADLIVILQKAGGEYMATLLQKQGLLGGNK